MSRLRKLSLLTTWVILTAYVAMGVTTAAHMHGLPGDKQAGLAVSVFAPGTLDAGATGDEYDATGGQYDHDQQDCPICDAAIVASALAVPTVTGLPQKLGRSQRLAPLEHEEPVAQRFPAAFDARGPPVSSLHNI